MMMIMMMMIIMYQERRLYGENNGKRNGQKLNVAYVNITL